MFIARVVACLRKIENDAVEASSRRPLSTFERVVGYLLYAVGTLQAETGSDTLRTAAPTVICVIQVLTTTVARRPNGGANIATLPMTSPIVPVGWEITNQITTIEKYVLATIHAITVEREEEGEQ